MAIVPGRLAQGCGEVRSVCSHNVSWVREWALAVALDSPPFPFLRQPPSLLVRAPIFHSPPCADTGS